MGDYRYRAEAHAISIAASHTRGEGWSLRVSVARPGEFAPDVDRHAYERLSADELVDVLEVLIHLALDAR